MQNPTYRFTEDHENTINPAATSSIIGFIDQVLNVRYGSYPPARFVRLLDEFCQIAIELAACDSSKPDHSNKLVYPTNKALLKKIIIEITRNREYSKLLSAVYFDSEANDGQGADVQVTYSIPQIFNLVLAATLDDEVYKKQVPIPLQNSY